MLNFVTVLFQTHCWNRYNLLSLQVYFFDTILPLPFALAPR